jgi:hypothetical protein
MRHVYLYTLILLSILFLSCGQQPKNAQQNGMASANKDTIPKSDELTGPSRYEYTDPEGKRLILENHLPKGGTRYTAPDGQTYGLVFFWSQFINETNTPLEVELDITDTAYEFPYPQRRYLKLLIPADTMTPEKVPLLNYGFTQPETFLDSNFHKSSLLKRTIGPNSSSGFYVLLLTKIDSTSKVDGTLRTGFSLKGQELFYRVSHYTPNPPNISMRGEKEYPFGRINLKNLKAAN